MKLSIITINYNNCAGLKKTIDSVVAQTYRDFEWLVIDGGSTDGSRALIEQNASHLSYWVSEPDHGVYHAMNKGLDAAQGEYLLFLNSGDWLVDADTLEKCQLDSTSADVLYGDSLFVFQDHIEEIRYPDPLSFNHLYKGFLGHASSFIKSSLLRKERYTEQYKIVSDWEFWIKMALKDASFVHLPLSVSYFDTTGISSTNEQLRTAERNQVISEFVPRLVAEDCKYIKRLETQLGDDQVKSVLHYGRKKKLYHKLITASLLVIKFLDRFCGHSRQP